MMNTLVQSSLSLPLLAQSWPVAALIVYAGLLLAAFTVVIVFLVVHARRQR